ncbi:MAG: hypothetical protein R3C28_24870 [Pirellulaceae bacterium]
MTYAQLTDAKTNHSLQLSDDFPPFDLSRSHPVDHGHRASAFVGINGPYKTDTVTMAI